jgi:hypothetical protein
LVTFGKARRSRLPMLLRDLIRSLATNIVQTKS